MYYKCYYITEILFAQLIKTICLQLFTLIHVNFIWCTQEIEEDADCTCEGSPFKDFPFGVPSSLRLSRQPRWCLGTFRLRPCSGKCTCWRQGWESRKRTVWISAWWFQTNKDWPITGWWQLKYFLCSSLYIWGRWTQFDDHTFQRGWNHQLDEVVRIGWFLAKVEMLRSLNQLLQMIPLLIQQPTCVIVWY